MARIPYYSSVLHTGLSKPDVISLALKGEIVRRELKEKQVFPLSVDEAAKELRTSKATVNLAWRDLAEEGIVEIKQGIGVIVKSPEKLKLDDPSQKMLFKVRTETEVLLGYWAAMNAKEGLLTEEDKLEMEKELQTQEELLTQKFKELERKGLSSPDYPEVRNFTLEYLVSDVRFHTAVRRSAHDKWVTAINEIVEWQTYLKRLESYYRDFFSVIQNSTLQHRAIFEAVRDGDPERATEEIRKHLDYASSLADQTTEPKV